MAKPLRHCWYSVRWNVPCKVSATNSVTNLIYFHTCSLPATISLPKYIIVILSAVSCSLIKGEVIGCIFPLTRIIYFFYYIFLYQFSMSIAWKHASLNSCHCFQVKSNAGLEWNLRNVDNNMLYQISSIICMHCVVQSGILSCLSTQF